ncbi:MFS transporter [Streptomyces decoyicus]|uniref:MFS transporter n=1 Tax=Streptomyces decoyicus TaxID=249567 RepID=UPI002E17BE07|nr:MFS transporter [Streptomyces decoyicus]WSV51288.1 MFS transporter [Streptomyces decoyicus]
MLPAGALSDRIGARQAHGGGLVLFALASAACGLAPHLGVLVAARLVQGAAAALMMPASLALVRQGFPDQAKRAQAIASAKLAARFGPRVPMVTGQLVATAGLLALLGVGAHTNVWAVAALMVPVGLGGALTVPALTAMLLDAVPADRAGTASAVLNTGRQVSGAIAVAVFGALLAGANTFLAGMRWSMLLAAAGLVLTAGATLTLPRDGRRDDGVGVG